MLIRIFLNIPADYAEKYGNSKYEARPLGSFRLQDFQETRTLPPGSRNHPRRAQGGSAA